MRALTLIVLAAAALLWAHPFYAARLAEPSRPAPSAVRTGPVPAAMASAAGPDASR